MIVRSPKPDSSFYILNKKITDDKRLSWAARGMLVYLLCKPDYWKISVTALVNETCLSIKNTRRDGVYAILHELIETGYLVKEQKKTEQGTFDGVDYFVYETPQETETEDEEPFTENEDTPVWEKPVWEKPIPCQTTLVNNITSLKKKNTESTNLQDGTSTACDDKQGEIKELSAKTWLAYESAFFDRYKVAPVRNAMTNKHMQDIVKRIGKDAVHVVGYYLSHNKAWYISTSHSTKALINDCEALRTQWATQTMVTETKAKATDKCGDVVNLINIAFDENEAF